MNEKKLNEPNFNLINPTLRHYANEAFEKKDAPGIMGNIDSHRNASLLEDNIHSFLDIGIYEEALFICMTGGCHCLPERWSYFIGFANLEKLRSIGDPIPTKPITVYRGVAYTDGVVDTSGKVYCGEEPEDLDVDYELEDFIRGYSWTRNKHTAAWFTTRLPSRAENLSGKGVVFYARVKPENILFCSNERGEEEVAVDIYESIYLRALKNIPKPIHPGPNVSIDGFIAAKKSG